MEEILPSAFIEFKHLFWVFGTLLVGIVIMRMGIKKTTRPPKGGRFFKRRLNED